MKIVNVSRVNGLNKTKGCEKSPELIIKALNEVYSSEAGKSVDSKLLDIDDINILNEDLSEDEKLIYIKAKKYFETSNRFVFLGGDHSISYPIVKAFLENCKIREKQPCLIVFDAHPDCMQPMKEPTHEEWVRALVESGFPGESILLVGVRNSWKNETEFIKSHNIRVMDCDKLLLDIEDACDIIMEFSSGKELYLSLDIDVVDPAFAPATGYKNEVGGLTSRQLIYLIKRISKIKSLRAVDLVEINSVLDKEHNMITTKLGAKVLAEFI